MAMMLITHDLGIVAGRTDAVMVMYAGRVMERAATRALFKQMQHPYTEALLAAIPKVENAPHTLLAAIGGTPPDPTRPSPGCPFAPRCRYGRADCREAMPELTGDGDHQFACWHPLSVKTAVVA
jgi:peptide/nickel transport system ATP-binding protein